MRNTLFAAAAAFALIVGTVPTFAAEAAKDGGSGQVQPPQQSQASQPANNGNNGASADCKAVMASQSTHTAAEVAACKK